MKAKLYIFEEEFELKLQNGDVLTPEDGESKEDFVERAKQIVDEKFMDDIELIEIDVDIVASNDDEALKEALTNASGLQKKLIETILEKRNSKNKKEKKEPRQKLEKRKKEDMEASQEYKDALDNVGKTCTFSPHGSEEVITGKIAGISLNKTNTRIYYTVVEESGKRKCCAALNPSVKLSETEESVKETKETKEKTKKQDKNKKENVVDDLV